ncbi:calcium/proton exchanger [Actinocrinis sp.]|uniref:calcium/proton exchanger n=1 Tax=Actinocrinis sp. TaxID=1920516 RepID=UPI002D422F87|nr:calcium/proton exchanger [Actinocrinis sp.]HZP50397.1 calcium/proton exchanger [Actinocrinis sp.]
MTTTQPAGPPETGKQIARGRVLSRSDITFMAGAAAFTVAAALTKGGGAVIPFLVSAVAVALLAALVGRAVDHLADRLGAGAVGVLQSALGNLPELFICIFALRSHLTDVVTAAIIGSILGNLLLVLGLSFFVGGRRNGILRFSESRARMIMALMILSVAAMLVPSLASYIHAAAASHEASLSRITAVVLLVVFALSIPASLRREDSAPADASAPTAQQGSESQAEHAEQEGGNRWPLALAVTMLAVTGVLAAYVSDLFVSALQPAMNSMHISDAFAGLVIVAIAGNAVENAVGVKLAWQNQADHALSVILNSPLQIALVLAPALVLLSPLVGGATFTLVFNPMLVTTVGVSTLAVAYLVSDGESDWLEGATMVGLYILIAAAFWWG